MQSVKFTILNKMVSMNIIDKARYEERQEGRKPRGWLTCMKNLPAEETAGIPDVFKEKEGSQDGWNGASKK